MEVAGAAIALVQAAEMAIKAGKGVVAIVIAYKHSDSRLQELSLRVEGIWLKTELQINVIMDIFSPHSEPTPWQERLLSFQYSCFDTLGSKLQSYLVKLKSLTGVDVSDGIDVYATPAITKIIPRMRYALFEKHIEGLVVELQRWQAVFDPSWYLLTRLVSPEVDKILEQTGSDTTVQTQTVSNLHDIRAIVRLTNQDTSRPHSDTVPQRKVPFLSPDSIHDQRALANEPGLQIGRIVDSDEVVVLDTTAYHEDSHPQTVATTVRQIARLLSIDDPFSMGFLKCVGLVKSNENQFIYVLALPKQQPVRLLRSLLYLPSPSLDAKFRIARNLAKTIMSLHAAKFVHKNIRPETVVVQDDGEGEMSQAYLVGFEQLRPDLGHSSLVADMVWQRNIYRHPSRQGLKVQELYVMQHDIYSLGVCLLEIGMWASFVGQNQQPPTSFDISEELKSKNPMKTATQIKARLIEKAETELPRSMGKKYTEVVLSCLTCLDSGATNLFEDEDDLYDEDGILVGVAFIEKILIKLDDITT
ncbi:uncharacterized protein A1O9_02986 [Exophiala aquamarina CBS 119918]|uniref:Protein kinase domain-containing protein n=1 Tax=Exophiala aquamarina CBS 119918 TaxID=1182545 RepID=A0A072Q0L0_9EURO|nr:uncharacterized protein A1O9_02986 [Exophiala aquamarina CBS 119918]KEF61420.1 hypothetical protein A1O9_02986 [Exophiala aquamarina CBS 119918]